MKITYESKVKTQDYPDIPEINKITADNINEIKNVVNSNYDDVGDIADLNTSDTSSVINAINEVNNRVETYSSTEVAVGKWIDGKTVYRKVLTTTTASASAVWKTIDTGVDVCIKYGGYYLQSNNTEKKLIPHNAGTNGDTGQWFQVDNSGNLQEAHNNSIINNKTMYFWYEYTKK